MGRMSVLTKKLHVMKTGGADEAISLYTTTSECAEPNLKLQVDGITAYAKLGDVSDSSATSLRVYRNSDGKTYAALKEATNIIATLTMKAGAIGNPSQPFYREYYGYTSNVGSLSPTSFKYNGTQYTISSFTCMVVPNQSNATAGVAMYVYFSTAPSFTKMKLDINGTEMELSQSSSTKTNFGSTITASGFRFVAGSTYTIKILSVS